MLTSPNRRHSQPLPQCISLALTNTLQSITYSSLETLREAGGPLVEFSFSEDGINPFPRKTPVGAKIVSPLEDLPEFFFRGWTWFLREPWWW